MTVSDAYNCLARIAAAATGVFVALLAVVLYLENWVGDQTGGVTTNNGVWPLVTASVVGTIVTLALNYLDNANTKEVS